MNSVASFESAFGDLQLFRRRTWLIVAICLLGRGAAAAWGPNLSF